MVIDRIENAPLYYAIHPRFKSAFDYIRQIDINAIPVGRHEIDGENMYALVQEYNTKLKEEGKWEAHRRYIDLQYVVQGAEGMGYANIHHLQQGDYDTNKDFLPLFGEGDQVVLKSGYFVLLFPEDAHMPGMAIGNPKPAKKVVIKIAVQ
ncbi:YhcH/YjgK/YiaL family protein [Candidatus Villigracilis affinis]|uniref:YhcH/YjgK/YiaL family protein n=1 Tax=Candidatus Villigracilis affinis TaxID=3140682 RepID=UPI002A1D6F37|nr:YhcH/YjgK/YiaL family protein [Anaerolineales bacterium]